MSLAFRTLPECLVMGEENWRYSGFYPGAVSPNGRYVLINSFGSMWVLDRTDESFVESAFDLDAPSSYSGVAIDDDGTIYALANPSVIFGTGALIKIENFGNGAQTTLASSLKSDVPRTLGLFVMPDASKKLVWAENEDGNDLRVYTIGTGIATVANGGATAFQQTLQDSYGDVWAVTYTTTKIIFQRVVDGGAGTVAPDYNEVTVDITPDVYGEAYHSSAGWFVANGGGNDLYLLDDTDFTIITHRDYGSGAGSTLNATLFDQPPFLLGLEPGLADFWFPGPTSYTESTYSDLHQINAADLTTLQEAEANADWLVGDEFDVAAGMIYSTHTREALISNWYGELIPVLRYFEEGGDETEEPGLTDEDVRIRVWGYSLDGHDFAVFRLGPSETLVFDRTSGQWFEWESPARENWRAHIGQNWVGMAADTFANGFGSDVVAGDDATGILWILDPVAGMDDAPVSGEPVAFDREVTGGITLTSRETVNCGAVQVSLSLGSPSVAGATITLETSDDHGQTWQDQGSIEIEAGNYGQVIEWRGLGTIRQPGRIFRFIDNGAAVRINGAEMRP